jgi:hypothetical protein
MRNELQEKYNQTVFLETIKTGKIPKRSGLGGRIFLLAGIKTIISSTCFKNVKPRYLHSLLTNKIVIYKNYSSGYKLVEQITHPNVKSIITKYLGYHVIEYKPNTIEIFYDKDVIPNWALLDNDLKIMYPRNCRIDKRGFVYYKH